MIVSRTPTAAAPMCVSRTPTTVIALRVAGVLGALPAPLCLTTGALARHVNVHARIGVVIITNVVFAAATHSIPILCARAATNLAVGTATATTTTNLPGHFR